MESQVELAEKTASFIDLMPPGQDQVLVVLKGHLLIEELLTEILEVKLEHSNPLDIKISSNTMFAQKLNLCWAIVQNDIESDIWGFLKELNSIRNKMAHAIEPKGINKKIELFNEAVANYEHYMMPKARGNYLEFSICYLYIVLSQFLHHVKNS